MNYIFDGYLARTLFDHPEFEPGTFGLVADCPNHCTARSAISKCKIYKIKYAETF